MTVAKTTKTKKTPAKSKPIVKKAEVAATKVETNKVQSVISIVYPKVVISYEYYSNMSVDDLKNYKQAWVKDELLEISVGLTDANKLAYLPNVIDHFAKMLIPARYIQSIRGYEDEG